MLPLIPTKPSPQPVSGAAPPVLVVQAFSYDDRREILAALAEAMATGGCWLLDRKTLSLSQMEYRFEVQLRSALDLYSGLVGCGLELTRASHQTLTGLCSLRRHNPTPNELGRVVTVRLEVSFLEDLDIQLPPFVGFA